MIAEDFGNEKMTDGWHQGGSIIDNVMKIQGQIGSDSIAHKDVNGSRFRRSDNCVLIQTAKSVLRSVPQQNITILSDKRDREGREGNLS